MSDEWITPYQYAKRHGPMRPQIVYYFVRERGAPHKVVNGKLVVNEDQLNDWLGDYLMLKEFKRTATKHVHGPECTEGHIIEKPESAPTNISQFLYVERGNARKRGARRGSREAVQDWNGMIDDLAEAGAFDD